MDKNIIKNHLSKRFISEESTPGISVTDKAKKESEKINKAGVKAIEKDVTDYDKALKQTDKNMSKMPINKYNYVDDAEKTYHEEMEILNGQEMIEYTSEPGAEFKKRAEEAIEGSSRMGNAIGGNAEETWGASSDEFGKKLIKKIKDSSKRRADAEIQTYGMGDVQIPTGTKVQTATTAVSASKPKGDTTNPPQSASEKTKIKVVKENNNKPQIKESMKRLTFKKEFEGANTTQKIGHALTLIPEHLRQDKKVFEMTDGTVTCKIRWEGTLNEGKAVLMLANDKTKINEDLSRMKELMGYKPQDTLGLVKGKERINENEVFGDIWNKTRKLLGESDDIEGQKADTGDLDDAVKVAPEAKKHIEGTATSSFAQGTKAPAPKKGPAGSIDKTVSHAPEAKKHVEGTATTSFAQGTDVPKPAEGEWEEINMPQSAEAKKHVHLKENDEIDSEDDVEVKDTFNKPDEEDNSPEEKEPTASDISTDIPAASSDDDDEVVVPKIPATAGPKLMKNPSTNEFFLTQNNKHLLVDEMGKPIPVPAEYVELARKNPRLALEKIQDAAESSTGEEEIDEYGDEHPMATSDAVNAMKTKK